MSTANIMNKVSSQMRSVIIRTKASRKCYGTSMAARVGTLQLRFNDYHLLEVAVWRKESKTHGITHHQQE